MNYTALSLSQTPPLSVPLPYFLLAPLFAVAAAVLMVWQGPELFATRWSPAMLALTHMLTVGVLGTTMIGALQQLVPVLVGVPLPAQRPLAYLLFSLWSLGSVLLIAGMGLSVPVAVQGGGLLLAVAVGLLLLLVLRSVCRSDSQHATTKAMGLAVASFAVAVGIALYLLLRFGGHLPLAHPLSALHIGWGSLGWLLVLVVGVAYQVVPMFQITPEYPARLRRWLAPVIIALLLLWSLKLQFPALEVIGWLLAAAAVLFAAQTLLLQRRRRRRLSDVTLDFWRLSMLCLLAAALVWAVDALRPAARLELGVGVLFFAGFAFSAVNGMLYKIVPFLVWLHLNNRLQQSGRRQGKIPNMKQVIAERHARRQYRLHLLALGLLLGALFIPQWLLIPAAVAWGVSALALLWNLLQALRLYRHVAAAQEAIA